MFLPYWVRFCLAPTRTTGGPLPHFHSFSSFSACTHQHQSVVSCCFEDFLFVSCFPFNHSFPFHTPISIVLSHCAASCRFDALISSLAANIATLQRQQHCGSTLILPLFTQRASPLSWQSRVFIPHLAAARLNLSTNLQSTAHTNSFFSITLSHCFFPATTATATRRRRN